MGVTPAVVTGRTGLGAVVVNVAAVVAPKQHCLSVCGQTVLGTAVVTTAGASNGVAVVGCKGGCAAANFADTDALAAAAAAAVVVVGAVACGADGDGVVAAGTAASNGLGGGGVSSWGAVSELDGGVCGGDCREEEDRWGVGHGLGLIFGPVGIPPWREGLVGERREGRGSLCPRGPASPCFDGLPQGFVYAIARPGGGCPRRA